MFETVLNKHLLIHINCAYRWNHIAAFTQKNYFVEKMKMEWIEAATGEFLSKTRPQVCNFIKKRLQRRCFPVNIGKLLRTPVLKNICERLLLNEKKLTNFDDYMVTAAYLEKCYLFYLQYVVNYSIIFCCVWQISQLLHCDRFHRNWFPRFGEK